MHLEDVRGSKDSVPSILTLAIDGCEWSSSALATLPMVNSFRNLLLSFWISPRPGLDNGNRVPVPQSSSCYNKGDICLPYKMCNTKLLLLHLRNVTRIETNYRQFPTNTINEFLENSCKVKLDYLDKNSSYEMTK